MGKWTAKTKRNAKIKKGITWWKRELVRSQEKLNTDKDNPRYTSRYRDGGDIKTQEARIVSIEKVIEDLKKKLK